MPYIPDGTVAELPEREWPRPRRRLFKWRRRRDQPPFDVPSVHFFGWLSHQIPYFSGPTSPRDLEVLERAALGLVWMTRGFHHCRMCPPPDHYGSTPYETTTKTYYLGSASLIVADVDGNPWVAPNLVLHYVTVHGYVPPTRVYDAPPDLVASVLHKGYPDITM